MANRAGERETKRRSCTSSYEACGALGERGVGKRKSFATRAEATAWHARGVVAAADGLLRPSVTTTVREVAKEMIDGIEHGTARNRSSEVYKPSALRGHQTALRLCALPAIGAGSAVGSCTRSMRESRTRRPSLLA